jgi:hypothetical protein
MVSRQDLPIQQEREMKIRIFVKEIVPPCWFDTDVGDGIEFRHAANDILLNGFVSKLGVIAASNIAAIFIVPVEVQTIQKGVVISPASEGVH